MFILQVCVLLTVTQLCYGAIPVPISPYLLDTAETVDFNEYILKNIFAVVDIMDHPFTLSQDPHKIRFRLFTKGNIEESHELVLDDPETITNSHFDATQKTIILIHGFWSNSDSPMPTTLKKAFLDAGYSSNIIVVDWGQLSTPVPKNIFWPFAYVKVAKNSRIIVIKRVTQFVRFMDSSNFAKIEELHIIGHSMGAHITGGIGRLIASLPEFEGRKVGRMSGLDPAGPGFNWLLPSERITKNDAVFVDIYHTAAVTLGIMTFTEGHANFMPNGGHHQPGCKDPDLFLGEKEYGSCSHNFVTKIFAASITKKFPACECSPGLATLRRCPLNCSESVLAGEQCPSSTRGVFYFETTENVYPD